MHDSAKLLAFLLVAGISGHTYAACTERDVRQLRASGIADAQIRRICAARNQEPQRRPAPTPAPTAYAPQQMSNICQAQATLCMLAQQGPPGARCWCNTPRGPSGGVLVRR